MEQIIGAYMPETILSNNIDGTVTIDTPSNTLNVTRPTNELPLLVGEVDIWNDCATIFDASTNSYVKTSLQSLVNDEILLNAGALSGAVPLGKELGIDTSTGKYYYRDSAGQWRAQPVGQTVSVIQNANGTITTNAGLGGTGTSIRPIDQQVAANTLLPNSKLTYLDSSNNHVSTTASAIANLSSNDWKLLGNTGTNSSVNFVGTTDAQPLVFRTQNTERARFDLADAFVLRNAVTNRRIVLYDNASGDQHQFYGLGINNGVFRFQIPVNASYVFYDAVNSTSSNERVRINSSGMDVNGLGYFGMQRSASDALLSRGANILNAVAPTKMTTAVVAPSETTLRLIKAGTNSIVYNQTVDFKVGAYSTGLGASAQLDIALNTGNTHIPNVNVLSVLSNKRVGINNTAPTQTLHITDTNAAILVGDSLGQRGAVYFGNTAHGLVRNYNNVGNDVGLYTTSGTINFGVAGSTSRQVIVNTNGLGVNITPVNSLHVGVPAVVNTTGIRTSITSASPATTETSYLAVNANGDIVKGASITGGAAVETAWSGLSASLNFGAKNGSGVREFDIRVTGTNQIQIRKNWGSGGVKTYQVFQTNGQPLVVTSKDVGFPSLGVFYDISHDASGNPKVLDNNTIWDCTVTPFGGNGYRIQVSNFGGGIQCNANILTT